MIKDEAWKKEKEELVASYDRKNKDVRPGGTVFCGSSLMERFPIEEWTCGRVVNRGVGGYTIDEYMEVIDICCTDLRPSKVFINIGSNDLNDDTADLSVLIDKYSSLIRHIKEAVSESQIYVMAYYPVNDDTDDPFMKEELKYRTNELINAANSMISTMCDNLAVNFIDVNAPIMDKNRKLVRRFSVDGVHITEEGYQKVYNELKKYIDD